MIKFEDLPKYNSKEWLSLESFDGEIWKDITGYEGYYQISNLGRVKSLSRYANAKNGHTQHIKEKIIKLKKSRGYDCVALYKDTKVKYYRVGRLVALEFLSNNNDLPQVNHKDCNVHNNTVDNLEWCTSKYNNNYADHNLKLSISRKIFASTVEGKIILSNTAKKNWGKPSKKMLNNLDNMIKNNCKKVAQYSMDGILVKVYNSLAEAYRQTGIFSQNIGRVCMGRAESTHGYKWSYV